SEVGSGSTFHFTACFGLPQETSGGGRPVDAAPLERLPILVADDSATHRRILEEMLTAWRMEPLLVDLGDGVNMRLIPIPSGAFIMGGTDGHADERPTARAEIDGPLWIGQFEVTNEQFAQFDSQHDSQVEPMHGYQFGVHGYPTNRPEQPVVRISWNQAMAFCRWLSQKTGRQFTLPTESQWEYACRAGSDTRYCYGDENTDFSPWANLAFVSGF
ncbi:hypothetical protein LCGC14_3128000, partial [marine sediment metagenome]